MVRSGKGEGVVTGVQEALRAVRAEEEMSAGWEGWDG